MDLGGILILLDIPYAICSIFYIYIFKYLYTHICVYIYIFFFLENSIYRYTPYTVDVVRASRSSVLLSPGLVKVELEVEFQTASTLEPAGSPINGNLEAHGTYLGRLQVGL